MDILGYNDYKIFLKNVIKERPKKGHGVLRQLSEYLNLHPTMLSHILNGKSHFSSDQTFLITQFLEFDEITSEYFETLVELNKASHHLYKDKLQNKLKIIKAKFEKLKYYIDDEKKKTLKESEQAYYYSDWSYGATRLLFSIYDTEEEVRKQLKISENRFEKIISFLVQAQILIKDGNKFKLSDKLTFIDEKSPFIWQNHRNWRQKGIERLDRKTEKEFFFTAPMTLSEQDFSAIREILLKTIKKISQKNISSNPELLACLNIDWITIKN